MTSINHSEAAAITDHNRAVWNRCAPTYATGIEALTAGATETLLDLAGVGADTELLDVGTGPGTVIGPATKRGARVSAVDLAPEMVAAARQRHPDTRIEIGDAANLDRSADSVDAVTMGFCLHHIPNPHGVLAEAYRVLRPGGRVAFSLWVPAERLEAFGIAFQAVAENTDMGSIENLQPQPIGAEPGDYVDLLHQSGFVHACAREVDLGWTVTGGEPVFDLIDRFLDLSTQPSDTRRAISDAIATAVGQRIGPDGTAHLPNPAIVAAATKP
jgi:SAM-dependent methyltransferase